MWQADARAQCSNQLGVNHCAQSLGHVSNQLMLTLSVRVVRLYISSITGIICSLHIVELS
jgi:hypothetical protein